MKTEDVQVWSCGGGTQSGAIAALIACGKLPKPDVCFMVDTGRERSSTWPFVEGFIKPQLALVSCELAIVPASRDGELVGITATSGSPLLPGFTTQSGSVGKLPGWCSSPWKQEVGMRYLRSLGVESARMWMGISTDELSRIRAPRKKWLQLWYPLIFSVRMSRLDCVQLIRSMGWAGDIPHSACWMCPNLSDAEWLDMKTNWPEDFAAACAIDRELNAADPHFWLHESCKPLDQVEFNLQHSMFSDRGCTGGCFT